MGQRRGLGLTVYAAQAGGAFKPLNPVTDTGQGSGAVAWLPVTIDQDGLSSLLQVWDSGGHAAFIVYSASVTGSNVQFRVRWYGEFPSASLTETISWVPFVTTFGQQGVVRLWNAGGTLACDFFRMDGRCPGIHADLDDGHRGDALGRPHTVVTAPARASTGRRPGTGRVARRCGAPPGDAVLADRAAERGRGAPGGSPGTESQAGAPAWGGTQAGGPWCQWAWAARWRGRGSVGATRAAPARL